ncbi:peptidoglycan-binding protein [Streptomyces sp. NBC_00569]|uniref:peptidoglycan-binding protein n=1 Tax=Streptomyces sp. NBC_00569 TaxID=2975780 RepID=UPI002E810D66|nr:peptidoglycan-binding protein [Streptomyces sp. NBC_00569]WUB92499.1 peptidoglycan-binding protein [Streptomyces sp. NBC_00569]
MPEIWMSQAIKADLGDHAPCDPALPPKAIAHITADRNATAEAPQDLVSFARLQNFFTHSGKSLAPHILWDPFTGAFAQFFPATSRSKALSDAPGGTRTNRAGEVVLQIEALFFPHCRADGRVCAALTDTPCKGWSELNAWIRSWGVPDTWPMGRPTNFVSARSPDVWSSRGGWYAHAHVPENNHVDPGSWPAFVQEQPRKPGGGPADRPEFEPFPGPSFFQAGRRSPIIAAMHRRLVAEDCDRYQSSSNIAVWGAGDARSYAAWQKKLGHSGSAANGIPGEASWDRLRVPNV